MKKPKIILAPQEAISFVREFADEFLEKILDCPEALITDESRLRDFSSFDAENAIGPGKKPGTFLFRQKFRRGPFVNKDAPWDIREIEVPARHFKPDIVAKVRLAYGVDITHVFEKPLPEVLQFIEKNRRK